MSGTLTPVRPTRSDDLMVAVLVIATDRGVLVNARRLYQQYRTHYSSYAGMVSALTRMADLGYLEKVGLHKWQLTTKGVHHALLVLARRYRKDMIL